MNELETEVDLGVFDDPSQTYRSCAYPEKSLLRVFTGDVEVELLVVTVTALDTDHPQAEWNSFYLARPSKWKDAIANRAIEIYQDRFAPTQKPKS